MDVLLRLLSPAVLDAGGDVLQMVAQVVAVSAEAVLPVVISPMFSRRCLANLWAVAVAHVQAVLLRKVAVPTLPNI